MTDAGLPTDWEIRHSNSRNQPYYFNASQQTSQWEPPSGTDTEKLKSYMAKHHSGPENQDDDKGSNKGKIRVAHLLVKHKDSRKPSSWRTAEIDRSREEAMDIVKGYEGQISRKEATLGELAVSESDCSSARKMGNLGFFGRGDMQAEFEEAAFKLEPGQVSGVVETASGLHLIERLE